jgi:hypothetical protein
VITNDQIHRLRRIALASGRDGMANIIETCDIALGELKLEPCLNTHPEHDCIGYQRSAAREWCERMLAELGVAS